MRRRGPADDLAAVSTARGAPPVIGGAMGMAFTQAQACYVAGSPYPPPAPPGLTVAGLDHHGRALPRPSSDAEAEASYVAGSGP